MYVWARLAAVLRRKPVPNSSAVLEPVTMKLRVWFSDVDMLGHINNGRYLTICDLGRFQISAATGLDRVFRENNWHPVVAYSAVRFRKSLNLFAQFELITRLIWWDDQWFYFEHRFVKGGDLYVKVLIKGTTLNKDGKKVPMKDFISALGVDISPPSENAPLIAAWQGFEEAFR